MNKEITQQRLKEVLRYDPDTGVFTWKVKVSDKVVLHSRAGQQRADGYRLIGLDGGRYLEHRLALLWADGAWPTGYVDHINGDPTDNRVENLRKCSQAENLQNTLGVSKSRHLPKGVGWHTLRGKWRAYIGQAGKSQHLGLFSTPEQAHQAYLAAKAQLHKFQPTPRQPCATTF